MTTFKLEQCIGWLRSFVCGLVRWCEIATTRCIFCVETASPLSGMAWCTMLACVQCVAAWMKILDANISAATAIKLHITFWAATTNAAQCGLELGPCAPPRETGIKTAPPNWFERTISVCFSRTRNSLEYPMSTLLRIVFHSFAWDRVKAPSASGSSNLFINSTAARERVCEWIWTILCVSRK